MLKTKRNDIRKWESAAWREIERVAANAAFALEMREKELIVDQDAVDTGFMLNSVQAVPGAEYRSGFSTDASGRSHRAGGGFASNAEMNALWIVGNGAEYSAHINYGTINQPARPFVEPAVDDVRPQYVAQMEAALRDVRY